MKKISYSLVLIFLLKITIAHSQIPLADLQHDVWFSNETRFPMSQRVCLQGECTFGGMKRNQIALTFDDGPNANTLNILNILRSYNIPATFFVHIGQGSLSKSRKQIMDRIYSDGHKIANHGKSHSPIHKSAPSNLVNSYLLDTHSVIANYLGRGDLLLYRNPGGYWSPGRAQNLNGHSVLRNYVGPIYWNVGGANVYRGGQLTEAADWECQQKRMSSQTCAQGYYNKIISNYRNNSGSLVLMHDIHSITASMLPILLDRLIQTGINWDFVFVQDIPLVRSQVTEI